MKGPPDTGQLRNLTYLRDVLDELRALVHKCVQSERIGQDDDANYDRLVHDAQELYGRVQEVIRATVTEPVGVKYDRFQWVLSTQSILRLISKGMVDDWLQFQATCRSIVAQAIGAVEETERQSGLTLSPEVVKRYQPLIRALEGIRKAAGAVWRWASSPFRLLDPMVERLEKHPGVRFLVLTGRVASGIAIIVVIAVAVLLALARVL